MDGVELELDPEVDSVSVGEVLCGEGGVALTL